MTTKRFAILLALLVLFTAGRIMTTHRVFSQTSDEPVHLVAGYDILTKGYYNTDLHHPPLSRFLFALPFLDSPDPAGPDANARGTVLLLRNERYTQNLARARLGNLVFVAIAIVVVALWARHLISPAGGLVAALLFSFLPPFLAHGGVATTDCSIAATLPLALLALTLVLENPTLRRTLFLGVAIGAGLLSKYSFVMFFPPCALILIVVKRRFPVRSALVAIAVAFVMVWGAFGFTFSTLEAADDRTVQFAKQIFGSTWLATSVPMPAPLFAAGALEVKKHDLEGHKNFLLGEMRQHGWWYYFPVALFFKTPIPFLILAIAGMAMMARRHPEIALIALAILGISMTSHINIGLRHVLPIYAPLSIAAAFAVVNAGRLRLPALALAAWLLAGSVLAHPDYLPWFNAFAGKHPERILSDSNLDWGQDLLRLVRTARAMKIDHLTVSLFTTTDIDRIGLPPHTILRALATDVHGWLAISETHIVFGRDYSPEVRRWLDDLLRDRPYQRIGKSIRLYNIGAQGSGVRAQETVVE